MYRYKGKIYSDDNKDAEYDLYDLFFELKHDGKVVEVSYYLVPELATSYEDIDEMLKSEAEYLGVEEVE